VVLLHYLNFSCKLLHQVLRFYGWLKQTVHESPQEHYRVRHVRLYYYLEDDSIEIIEKQIRDSGMPQGCTHVVLTLWGVYTI